MPLDDTPFNRAKSDLKFIEAGACRVASLASSVVYQDSIVHGETGLIFRILMNFTAIFCGWRRSRTSRWSLEATPGAK